MAAEQTKLSWPEKLLKARHTWKDEGGRRLVHFELPGGCEELLEEYDLCSCSLLVRKTKTQTQIGKWTDWTFEIGESDSSRLRPVDFQESALNPVCIRQDDKEFFIWRIRNLPFPLPNYSCEIDSQQRRLIVKTQNHKYYKTITLPDLDRMALPLPSTGISLEHRNSTLIIKYKKPKPILELERLLRAEVKHLPEKMAESEKTMMESVSKMMGDLMKKPPLTG